MRDAGDATMAEAQQVNQDQARLWNETSGPVWVEMQGTLDAMLAPFGALLVEQGLRDETRSVLDVGCGAGWTTFAAARRLGQNGTCVGVDISAPLVELATQRARAEKLANVSFVRADAQTHAFEPNRFDAVISRFGVMFFDDPVAAFANIRRAARPDAALTFVAWRSPAENPFMTTAARAAAPYLPSLPKPDPDAPGQFGLADSEKIQRILEASGWKGSDTRPIDISTSVPERELLTYVTKLGPVGMALREVDEDTRARTTKAVHAAFAPFVRDGAARFTTACWLVTARA
jgi:SAM-dependent methyltransferase